MRLENVLRCSGTRRCIACIYLCWQRCSNFNFSSQNINIFPLVFSSFPSFLLPSRERSDAVLHPIPLFFVIRSSGLSLSVCLPSSTSFTTSTFYLSFHPSSAFFLRFLPLSTSQRRSTQPGSTPPAATADQVGAAEQQEQQMNPRTEISSSRKKHQDLQ